MIGTLWMDSELANHPVAAVLILFEAPGPSERRCSTKPQKLAAVQTKVEIGVWSVERARIKQFAEKLRLSTSTPEGVAEKTSFYGTPKGEP
jgi:hypothetical protein